MYNVVSARGTRLLGVLRAMADLNTDIAVLTETKLCGGRHARQGFGYSVFATSAASPHQGGVVLVWRTKPSHWLLEGVRTLSANSLSAILVSGTKCWLLLGTYLLPNVDLDSKLGILEAEGQRHPNVPVILMGNLNADLSDNTNAWSIAVTTMIQHLGAVNTFHRFMQKKKRKRRNTRHQRLSDGTQQRSRCDYALVDPSIDMCSICIVIPPRFHSDHWAVKLQIRSSTPQDHRRYIHNRSQLPHVRPKPDEKGPNQKFEELLTHRIPILPVTYPSRDAWIANDTWVLIDKRNAALKRLATPNKLRPLRKAIRKKVRQDRATRLALTGNKIQTHLDADDPKEAWRLVKVWYRHQAHTLPPTSMDLRNIGKDYHNLFTQQEPPGEPIHGLVTYDIPDNIPDGDEIGSAIKTLCNGCAPAASGMKVEDLKKWHAEWEDTPAPWLLVVEMVQHAFLTGVVLTRAWSNMLVLIPKPEPGQVHGIGLLEPVWKLISSIVHLWLMKHIKFHEDLHGFLPEHGTGTACLEAKLAAQLAYHTGQPLYHIYLDFAKAYDSLDRARMLILLQDYGVGPNIIRLIALFWE